MHFRQASLYTLTVAFVLSLCLLICAIKYAEWAAPTVVDQRHWILLIFYLGTMPLTSFLQNTVHFTVLHFDAVLPNAFVIFIAVMQIIGWLIVSALWTTCESSRASSSPAWCPQHSLKDGGRNLSFGLTIFKDVLAWLMVVVYVVLAGAAWRGVHHDRRVKWRQFDQFYELRDYETRI